MRIDPWIPITEYIVYERGNLLHNVYKKPDVSILFKFIVLYFVGCVVLMKLAIPCV